MLNVVLTLRFAKSFIVVSCCCHEDECVRNDLNIIATQSCLARTMLLFYLNLLVDLRYFARLVKCNTQTLRMRITPQDRG
jgi:hypothetical protein